MVFQLNGKIDIEGYILWSIVRAAHCRLHQVRSEDHSSYLQLYNVLHKARSSPGAENDE